MNKKGFTLVELLAVVVILALLAIVTGTAVTKMVKDSKQKLSDAQKNLISSAAEAWAADNIDRLPDSNTCIYVTVEELIGTGYLKGNIIDPKTGEAISDDYSVKICGSLSSYGALVYTYEVDESGSGASGGDSGDSGGSGGSTIQCQGGTNVGDLVTCGSENFYVIEDAGSKVIAITEKLVDVEVSAQVGFTCDSLSDSSYACPRFATITTQTYQGSTYRLGYWLNPDATNYATIKSGSYPIEDTVEISNKTVNVSYVFDSNSVIYSKLNGYKAYLTNLGLKNITVSLPSYAQLKALGCDLATHSCSNAPAWVYNSSYWTGSGTDVWSEDMQTSTRTAIHVITVDSSGYIGTGYGANRGEFGVRPTVTIKKTQIG